MRRSITIAAVIILSFQAAPTMALDLLYGDWRGHEAVLASGSIRYGDAEKTERRSALISAAVTGKIDVRGWSADAEQGETTMKTLQEKIQAILRLATASLVQACVESEDRDDRIAYAETLDYLDEARQHAASGDYGPALGAVEDAVDVEPTFGGGSVCALALRAVKDTLPPEAKPEAKPETKKAP